MSVPWWLCRGIRVLIAPVILQAMSLGAMYLGLSQAEWADLVLLALPCSVASLYLILRAIDPWHRAGRPLIIDGSNVMHWAEKDADLKTVKKLVRHLSRKGFRPGVIFDANAGYKLSNRYLDDADLARALNLPVDRVLVVPKGTTADEYILEAARDLRARVVTNDRYRDWDGRFPEVKRKGFLIRGAMKHGRPLLEWNAV